MIKYYQHFELPYYGDGVTAANACLSTDPPRPPGGSCEFSAAAAKLCRIAAALREALSRLEAVRRDEGLWQGDGAAAFKDLLQDPARTHLDEVPARYEGYAAALRAYATTLDGHQATIDAARARVQAAVDEYDRARAAKPVQATRSFGVTLVDTDRDACAVQDCLAAARRFQAAYNEWIDSARTCQHAIKKVDSDNLRNAHGMHAAVDAIAGFADTFANLTTVLSIIVLPFAPELSLVLLSLSSFASGVKLTADSIRAAAYGEDVGWDTFVLDALGSIPVFKPVSEGVRGARAAKAAGVLGKLGEGAGRAGRGFRREFADMYRNDIAKAWKGLKEPGAERLKAWEAQDIFGYGASAADSGWKDRKRGWRTAVTTGVVSVTWEPIRQVPGTAWLASRANALAPAP